MKDLIEGKIVHYVPTHMDGIRYPEEHRPAIVVKVWYKGDGAPPDNGCCNIQVFLDGTNDRDGIQNSMMWKTSVIYNESKTSGTWHWIETPSQ